MRADPQSRILRVLSRLLILLLVVLSILIASYYTFTKAATHYTDQQVEQQAPLHIAQLDTYYENRQFSQMNAYLRRHNLYDTYYGRYQQAVAMADVMNEFRNNAFHLSRLSPEDLIADDTDTIQNVLQLAHQIYDFENTSSYTLLISPNDELLEEFQTEVSLSLENVLQLSSLEIASVQKDDLWQSDYFSHFLLRLQERLVQRYE